MKLSSGFLILMTITQSRNLGGIFEAKALLVKCLKGKC